MNKFIQISLLNTAADDLSTGSADFFKPEHIKSMDLFDSVLSQKTNMKVINRMMDNVSPALNVTMRRMIEEEAKKILYSLNHHENLSSALAQLYYAQLNPESVKAKAFVDMMKNEFKGDQDVELLLQQRPTNVYMRRGFENPTVLKKINQKIQTLMYENPIEALQAFWESITLTDFDVSQGNSEKKAIIENKLKAYLGDLENPIDDAMQYALVLLMAHNSLSQAALPDGLDSLES